MHTLEIYSSVFAFIPCMHFNMRLYTFRHNTTHMNTRTQNYIIKFSWIVKITMELNAAIETLLQYTVSYDKEVGYELKKKNDGVEKEEKFNRIVWNICKKKQQQQQRRSYKIFQMGWIQVTFKMKTKKKNSIDIYKSRETRKGIKFKDKMNLQSLFVYVLHFIVTWERSYSILFLGSRNREEFFSHKLPCKIHRCYAKLQWILRCGFSNNSITQWLPFRFITNIINNPTNRNFFHTVFQRDQIQ